MEQLIKGEHITSLTPGNDSGYVLLLSETMPLSIKTETSGHLENCHAALISPAAGPIIFPNITGSFIRFCFKIYAAPSDEWLSFSECDLLKSFFLPEKSHQTINTLFFRTISDHAMNTARQLLKECNSREPYAVELSLCYLSTLLIELCRFDHVVPESSYTSFTKCETDQVIDYIKCNYAGVTLTNVAETFHYHPKTVSALVRRVTGHSFSFFRNELRLQNAARLIRSGCSVQQAATQCGYSNMTNFYKQFTLYYGEKPGMYRADSQKDHQK